MKKTLFPVIAAILMAIPATSAFAHKDTPGIIGEHDMTGTVKQIDHKKGTLTLQTKGGPTLHLHFPADDLKDVKNGDAITVHLGFTKGGDGNK
ncbi:hypothetical protein [Cupriavidus sp. CuC1]|uniref:hypothetical protein n=1 Tax=Cupriavidus sp. CuC1 TaxID=3373131 RepID=UPI0037D38EDC